MKSLNHLLLTLTSLYFCSNAIAGTYYVDAAIGNDSWSGTTASVSATKGPWQSIARVNAALLQPGDQVLFSCGQTWYETLKPASNGTTAAKIYFGSYPSLCADKPKISGFRSVADYNWQLHQGNIWKTTFPQNLIINRRLSGSVTNWVKWPSDASLSFNTTCPLPVAGCMNFLAGTSQSGLAISNSFPVVGGQKYRVSVTFYASKGTSIALIVRENSNAYTDVGLAKTGIIGNDNWQNVTVEFTATRTVPNARLDIEVPKTTQLFVQYANVQKIGVQSQPSLVMFDRDPVTIAHHPNAGYDTTRPESVYLRTSAASPTIMDSKSRAVSSQILVPDLKLPSGGSVDPGTKLMLRSVNWEINAHTVTGVGTNMLAITPNTSYPLSTAGWGFYFYDALWMLDSPGEWFFDNAAQTLYLWTPTNENPGTRVSVAAIDTAIALSAKSNLTVENLEIDGVTTGVDIINSTNISLRYLNIHNITGDAIIANQSVSPTIGYNRIIRAGLSAIDSGNSTNALIENNELSEIGILLNKAGKRLSLPMTPASAIFGGPGSIIQYNFLSDLGSNGITGGRDMIIDSNVIQRSCLAVNDCGAIYLAYSALRTVILNNLILDVPGDLDGTPAGVYKHAIGIYLDEGINGISVSGNTVKGATYTIQIHNGSKHTINHNILYGSERGLIFQQETYIGNGGISGNIFTGNQFFPTVQDVAFKNTSIFGDVAKFATYDNNHYSIIQSPKIISEIGPGFSRGYKFMDWQTAATNGIARNNDLNGDTPAPLASIAQGITGPDFMTNGDFSNGLKGWSKWNAVAPIADMILEGCLPESANCTHVVAGASETEVNSPMFTIMKGKFYRVTFDLKSTVNSGFLYPRVMFAGPSNYANLTKTSPDKVAISNQWQRHSFLFEAVATAANPTIANQGARFNIGGIPSGLNVWIANLEIATFDPGVFGPTKSDMLVNTTDIYKAIDCPTKLSNPDLCSNYISFPEGTVATWPVSVAPRSGKIVFTQNLTLHDSDGDGVSDSQDKCPNTIKELEVNTKGCSLLD